MRNPVRLRAGDKPAGLRLRLRIVLPRWGNDIPTKMLFLQAVTFP